MFGNLLRYKHYRNSLLKVLAISILSIIVISVILNAVFSQISLRQTAKDLKSQTTMLAVNVDSIFLNEVSTAKLLLSDKDIYSVIYGKGINRVKEAEAARMIRKLRSNDSTIEHLGIINGYTGRYIGTRGVVQEALAQLPAEVRDDEQSISIYRQVIQVSRQTSEVITMLYKAFNFHSRETGSLIVVDIGIAKMFQQIQDKIKPDTAILLYDRYGELMAANGLGMSLVQDEMDISRNLGEAEADYRLTRRGREKYLSVSAGVPSVGMRLVEVVPYDGYKTGFYAARKAVLIYLFVGVVVLGLVALLFRLKIALHGLDRAGEDAAEKAPAPGDGEGMDRTTDRGRWAREPLLALLSDPGWQEAAAETLGLTERGSDSFQVLVVSVDSASRQNWSPQKKTAYADMVRACIRDMTYGISAECARMAVCDEDGFEIAVLYAMPRRTLQKDTLLGAEEMLLTLQEKLGLSASVGFGLPAGLTQARSAYAQARNALNLRLSSGPNRVFVYRQPGELKNYPTQVEKKLIGLLPGGTEDQVDACVDQFVAEIAGGEAYEISASAIRLYMTLLSRFSYRYELFRPDSWANVNIYEQVERCQNVNEITRLLRSLTGSLREALADSARTPREDSDERCAREVCAYIDGHYGDVNLSLTAAAEYVNLSPSYVGKRFMRVAGVSFNEYVNQTRMEKAMDLLQGSDMPIKQIITEVGMTNVNYFYTLFKKFYGVTPGALRKKRTQATEDESQKAD